MGFAAALLSQYLWQSGSGGERDSHSAPDRLAIPSDAVRVPNERVAKPVIMFGVDSPLLDMPVASRKLVVRALADGLRDRVDVVFGYLHGSFAASGPFHDVDVAVFLDDPAVRATDRVLELADSLTRVAGYPVDVRAINEAPLAFQFRALQGRLLVVHDEERLANFMERVGRLYLDIAPVLRRATRDAFAR